MRLTPFEKMGQVMAFIPGVSTITGIIKAFVYRHKIDKIDKKMQENQQVIAGKVHHLSDKLNLNHEKREVYEKLLGASIAEAIPGVNLIAAIYSSSVLSDLSDLREVNDDLKHKVSFLMKTFDSNLDVKFTDKAKLEKLGDALIDLEKARVDDVPKSALAREIYSLISEGKKDPLEDLKKEAITRLYDEKRLAYNDSLKGLSDSYYYSKYISPVKFENFDEGVVQYKNIIKDLEHLSNYRVFK